MKTFNERLSAIIVESGLNKTDFSIKIGIKPTSLFSYTKVGGSEFGGKQTALFQKEFPQFNTTWLFFGEGEMYNAGFERPKKSESSETVEELRAVVESMRQEMDSLQKNMRWVMNLLSNNKQDYPVEVGKAKANLQGGRQAVAVA